MRVAKAYMAGAGATAALVAAAAVSLLTLATLFAVNGFPEGLGPAEADSVVVAPPTGAPESAA
ncbi:MAG: hypothetical protein ACRDL3_14205, partial [Solirubrobacterales bacterium]